MIEKGHHLRWIICEKHGFEHNNWPTEITSVAYG